MNNSFTVKSTEWDRRFMCLAREIAKWSKDPDEQVGAIVVSPDRRHFSVGYNGLPWGMPDDPEILCNKELKNSLTIHAEQNALANATFDLTNWAIYSTKAPCLECALMIHQNRIKSVFSTPIRSESRWAAEQYRAKEIMENLGIEVVWIPLENIDVKS